MSLNYSDQSDRGGIVILHLHGRLIVGEPVSDLRGKNPTASRQARSNNVVLNIGEVDYVDSTGWRHGRRDTSLKKAGGALKWRDEPS